MGAIFFTAILETAEGEFLESGWAALSDEPNSIDFKGEFVPLLQIGTSVRIVRTLHDKRLQVFNGTVFAASKNFLRLTSVNDKELDLIRPMFSSNIWVSIQPSLYYRSILPFSHKKADKIDATIYFISQTEIHYLSMDEVEWNQKLIVSTESPVFLDDTEIDVRQIIEYGGIANCYICNISNISKKALSSIQNYLDELSIDQELN